MTIAREPAVERRLLWCGDTGLLVELPDVHAVQSLYAALADNPPAGTIDIVPAARTVLLKVDLCVSTRHEIEAHVLSLPVGARTAADRQLIEIPVIYDGADLEAVAKLTQMSCSDVVSAHTGTDWTVMFCGFSPGYAYLSDGDVRLEVPRRGESRTQVPSGSVALAGSFSAVYPRESPGGWQLIGHTDAVMWDTHRTPPALLQPGMTVRFIDSSAR